MKLFGGKKQEVNVEEIRKKISGYQHTIDVFQTGCDAIHAELITLDQLILQSTLFDQDKAVDRVITRNDYEEVELGRLKNHPEHISVNPVVENLCLAKCYLTLNCIVSMITHSELKNTFQYVADLPRASIRAKYLTQHLNKAITLINESLEKHVSDLEKSFFNFHLRKILDGAIEVYQQFMHTFNNDRYRDELKNAFNEHFVPRSFYPLLENKFTQKNTMTPEEIFAGLANCITQVAEHLAKDPMYNASLPNVKSLLDSNHHSRPEMQ